MNRVGETQDVCATLKHGMALENLLCSSRRLQGMYIVRLAQQSAGGHPPTGHYRTAVGTTCAPHPCKVHRSISRAAHLVIWVLHECLPLVVLLENSNFFHITVPFENFVDVVNCQVIHVLIHLRGILVQTHQDMLLNAMYTTSCPLTCMQAAKHIKILSCISVLCAHFR